MRNKIICIVILGMFLLLSSSGVIAEILKNKSNLETSDIEIFEINPEFDLFAPGKVLHDSAYNFNDFSILASGDIDFNAWISWINEATGESGSFLFKEIQWHPDSMFPPHSGLSLQIDNQGYIWATYGGYAHNNPGDPNDIDNPINLYKSKYPLQMEHSSKYNLVLEDYAYGPNPNYNFGECAQSVLVIGDKVNLFFRNGPNDVPYTGTQHLQYSINNFNNKLIDKEISKGEYYADGMIIPCYTWGRVDPRYNIGFVTYSSKYQPSVWEDRIWGAYPFICLKENGDKLVNSNNIEYSYPIKLTDNADIPLNNIKDGNKGPTGGTNVGITPGGRYYILASDKVNDNGDLYFRYKLFIHDGSKWNKVFEKIGETYSPYSSACGVTKDYLVLLYSIDNEMFIKVSKDDGTTWSATQRIIEENKKISGITFAQPSLDYTDNTIRFFYGITDTTGNSGVRYAHSKHFLMKFDASDYDKPNSAPSKPELTGPPSGKPEIDYEYDFLSTDPNGEDIYYIIDWGDESEEITIGPFPSGEKQTATHSWDEQDSYTVKVKARDVNGAESEWAELVVTMVKSRNILNLWQNLLVKYPLIKLLLSNVSDKILSL